MLEEILNNYSLYAKILNKNIRSILTCSLLTPIRASTSSHNSSDPSLDASSSKKPSLIAKSILDIPAVF